MNLLISKRGFCKGIIKCCTMPLVLLKAVENINEAQAQSLDGPESGALNRAASGSSCTTTADSRTGNVQTSNIGDQSFTRYWGGQFTAGSTYTLCSVTFQIKKTGTPAGNIRAGFFTDNGSNLPNTQVGNWSSNVLASGLTTSFAAQSFSGFTGVSLTSGTLYWAIINYSITDASNFINSCFANFTAGHSAIASDTAGAPTGWSSSSAFQSNLITFQ